MSQPYKTSTAEWATNKLLPNVDSASPQAEQEKLAFLRREKVDKPTICIGTATCGVVAGAMETREAVADYFAAHSIQADIVEVGCLGLCSDEPIMEVQLPAKPRIIFSKVAPGDVHSILSAILNYTVPTSNILGQHITAGKEPWEGVPSLHDLPFFVHQQRIVMKLCGLIDPNNILEYIAHGGYRPYIKTLRNYTPENVCEILEKSGLRGRGGRGYLTAQKWKIAKDNPADQKYLICNADESDPGAFMDRAIIEGNPHQVIEGMAIAAYAIGATKAYIHIRKEYSNGVHILENALRQSREYGLIGNNIMGSGMNLNVMLRCGAGAFVCGEETALISSLEGKRGMPHHKPPFPTQTGLFNKPTVVNNVETLANVPLIFEKGPQWFSSLGTDKSKGTKVFAISGKALHTGYIEVAMGTDLRKIVFEIAGGIRDGHKFKALHLGGPSGNCLPENMLNTPMSYESLEEMGIMMGSGGMVFMDENTCMIDIARYFINFMKKESCGKCIPCREGTRRISEILDNATRRPIKESGHDTLERFKGVMQLESLSNMIKITSLCGLGKTVTNPVVSTLRWFREEYEEHIFDRTCRAGVCHELRTFYIEVDKCTGCTICEKKCPVDAIVGTQNNPFFIVEEKCIGCGVCYDVCKFSAVYVR